MVSNWTKVQKMVAIGAIVLVFILVGSLVSNGKQHDARDPEAKAKEFLFSRRESRDGLGSYPESLEKAEEYPSPVKQPNIVFFIVDDLGWGNVEYHQEEALQAGLINPTYESFVKHEVKTPNLNHYANVEGLDMARHYVHSDCTPTRSSFFTGRLPVHVQLKLDGPEDPRSGIPRYMSTFPKFLQDAGYKTHMIGKWDVGFASFEHTPKGRGFDSSLIYSTHGNDAWSYAADIQVTKCAVFPGYESLRDLWEHNATYEGPAEQYLNQPAGVKKFEDDMFFDEALKILDEHAKDTSGRPFYLNFASHLMHQPLQLPEEHLINGSFADDSFACALTTSDVYPGFTSARKLGCRHVLNSMVRYMDVLFGRMMQKLKDVNLWDDTLVVFTSDNGGSIWPYESGSNNFPLRGGKMSEFEGGIRVTTFVTGGALPAHRKGERSDQTMHVADWFATFMHLAGVPESQWRAEVDINARRNDYPKSDSKNMWPVIADGNTLSPRWEILVGPETLIVGPFKYMVGLQRRSGHPPPIYPTNSTLFKTFGFGNPYFDEMDCTRGCLFNVASDPREMWNVAFDRGYERVLPFMARRLEILKQTIWENNDTSAADSCPGPKNCPSVCPYTGDPNCDTGNFGLLRASAYPSSIDCVPCGCWMFKYRWNETYGPFQDVTGVNCPNIVAESCPVGNM